MVRAADRAVAGHLWIRGLVRWARERIDALPPVAVAALVLAVAAGVALAAALVVTELVEEVMGTAGGSAPDDRITAWVVDRRSDTATTVLRPLTDLAGWMVVIPVVAVVAGVLWHQGRRGLAGTVVAASGGVAVLTGTLKLLVGRDRPLPADRLVDASGSAFPSGHSAQAVALYGVLAAVLVVTSRGRRRRGLLVAAAAVGAGVLALVVGASRVYLGVHWPSDVVSGWIVGGAWLVVVLAVAWVLGQADRPRGWWPDAAGEPAEPADGPADGAALAADPPSPPA